MNAIPKVYTLGHRHTNDILTGNIAIQEKIDGSQFSFQWVAVSPFSVLTCRSKGQILSKDAGMFRLAVDSVQRMMEAGLLHDGWVYQCEFLAKPKHNVLTYDRVPKGNLALFDVFMTDLGVYMHPCELQMTAERLGIEAVTMYYDGPAKTVTDLNVFLDYVSQLGGQKVEGIVIKNYGVPHFESESGKAPRTAKIVSDKFKEVQGRKPINPKAPQNDLLAGIIARYRTEARWLKAIQHLKERGALVNGPEDIGMLLHEIQEDVMMEDGHDMAELLLAAAWKQISKGICEGFPQFYKKILAEGPSVFQDTIINKTNAN